MSIALRKEENLTLSNATEMVDYIIQQALRRGASDIHVGMDLSPGARHPFLVRFRVYGKLQAISGDFLQGAYKEVIARIKVMAGLDTTEAKVPQDGQITVDSVRGLVTLRVNTIPAVEYEEVVLRVGGKQEQRPSIDQLMMTDSMFARFSNVIKQKSGIILLNGPAGSGKTTTIYSILSHLASIEKKVVTAEDPVETHLPNVSHFPVTPKTTFAKLCKAFMRQDADVIFIGEIRDPDSASAAIQLAQTGHLVVSTLHTRDAVGVISRLNAFDIHPNFIATSLIGSLGQRLIPYLCQHCKVEQKLDERAIKFINKFSIMPQGTKFFGTGPGCEQCLGGVAGRMPVFELFVPDGEIYEMINRNDAQKEILRVARTKGMTTLAEEMLMRVYAGYIDLKSIYSYLLGA